MHIETIVFAVVMTIVLVLQYRAHKKLEQLEQQKSIDEHQRTCPGFKANSCTQDLNIQDNNTSEEE